MLFGEIITVYCGNHMTHTNTQHGQNVEFLNVKAGNIYMMYKYHRTLRVSLSGLTGSSCYIGKTSKPLEVSIKEQKYFLIDLKIKISPTCTQRRPQNMLERSEGLAHQTKHHLQGIQGIHPHQIINQSAQLGHLSQLDSHYCSRVRKLQPHPV
jgi:hypothetical protein